MKDLLRLLVTVAILALVVRYALKHVRPLYSVASGVGQATLTVVMPEDVKVAIRASAVGDIEPKSRLILDVKVNRKSCSQPAEAYRKPSTPSRVQAELRCPERLFKGGEEYVVTAVSDSLGADPAKVELIVEKAKEPS